jgi:hypothetical protein
MQYYNGARTHLALNKDAPGTMSCSGRWANSVDANSWRITPSICSDLISDRDSHLLSQPLRRRIAGHCKPQQLPPLSLSETYALKY